MALINKTYDLDHNVHSCDGGGFPPRDLSDVDKDGRLSADEFAIAMHLIEKAKSGLVLPKTLPAELKFSPAKFNTVERLRRSSEDTIEDKRKENFEMGRMELERRRRARQEQLERDNVSWILMQSYNACYMVVCNIFYAG